MVKFMMLPNQRENVMVVTFLKVSEGGVGVGPGAGKVNVSSRIVEGSVDIVVFKVAWHYGNEECGVGLVAWIGGWNKSIIFCIFVFNQNRNL
jgi:hypothetical protein